MMGEDAARHFDDGRSFTRVDAMPQITYVCCKAREACRRWTALRTRTANACLWTSVTIRARQRLPRLRTRMGKWLHRWRASGTVIFHIQRSPQTSGFWKDNRAIKRPGLAQSGEMYSIP
jgi:hypothetical protein